MCEKILPHPVLKDGNGKLIKDHSVRDFYLKLQEEIFEAVEVYLYDDEKFAEEVADIITVCISFLESRGIDEAKRSEIFRQVNLKNEKRGYFGEG